MAEEIVKTIEGVDKLFSQIVVNGEVHKSQRYVNQSSTVQQTAQDSNNRSTVGEDIYGAELNGILHNFVDRAVTQGLTDEATARQLADNILQTALETIQNLIPTSATPANKLVDSASVNSAISSEVTNRNTAISDAISTEVTNRDTAITNAINALDVASAGGNGKYIKAISETNGKISATEGTVDSTVSSGSSNPVTGSAVSSAINPVQASVSNIEALIPSQATTQNQLADKDFVNSSISTNTANFLGTYNSLADIQAIQNPTNNDYAFLRTTDQAGNTVFDRYKYNAEQNQWLYEYELNNSSFTAEQWATINSGLTSTSVSDAINALDVASAGGNGKYIKAISETNGKISATEGTIDSSVSSSSSNPVTGSAVYSHVDTVVTQAIAQVLNTSY